MVQWLGLCTSTAGGIGLIPGQGVKILQVAWYNKKKKRQKTHLAGERYMGILYFLLNFAMTLKQF